MNLNRIVVALIAGLFVLPPVCGAQEAAKQADAKQADARQAEADKAGRKGPAYLPMPEPVMESFRKPDLAVDPKVWQLTGTADAEAIKAKHARLPKRIDVVTRTMLAAKPGEPVMGQRSDQLKPLENGFILFSSGTGLDVLENESTTLSWLGLMPVYTRAHVTVQTPMLVEGTVTTQLAELAGSDLKPGAIAPGAVLTSERTYLRQTHLRSVGLFNTPPRNNERRVPSRLECKVGERIAAAEVFAEFTGSALKVSCAQTVNEESASDFYYLEDYAWFLLSGTRSKTQSTESKITAIVK